MAVFPVLEAESTLQIGDKTRLSGTKSFVSKDNVAVTLVEIEPEAGAGFIPVTGTSYKDWYLDWVYAGATRTVVASLRVTAGGVATTTKSVSLLTAASDYLFSTDADLVAIEPDILKWVPEGRTTFINVHREAQIKILDWLDEAGITNVDGDRLTKDRLRDLDEVRSWSKYMVLSLIFRGIYNSVDDVFVDKAKFYASLAKDKSSRTKLRLDIDGDGATSVAEDFVTLSRDLVRE